MVCCRYFKVSKWFDVHVLGFQIELCCRNLGLFCLGDFLGYFLKYWVIFFQIIWSPCCCATAASPPNDYF
jgi:hypothetical protein